LCFLPLAPFCFFSLCQVKFTELDNDGNRVLTYEEVMKIRCAGLLISLVPPLAPLLGATVNPLPLSLEAAQGGDASTPAAPQTTAAPRFDDQDDAAAAEAVCRHAWRCLGKPYFDEVPRDAFAANARAAGCLVYSLVAARRAAAWRCVGRAAREHRDLAAAVASLPWAERGWLLSTSFVSFCDEKFEDLLDCLDGLGAGGRLDVAELRPLLRSLSGVNMLAPEVRDNGDKSSSSSVGHMQPAFPYR
jgi:hypothetical protein